MGSRDFYLMTQNYRLTTAEILYRLPDHPSLLQSFIWQELDLAPEFPVLHKFLHFWEREIEGRLHSVRVSSCEPLRPGKVFHVDSVFTLH